MDLCSRVCTVAWLSTGLSQLATVVLGAALSSLSPAWGIIVAVAEGCRSGLQPCVGTALSHVAQFRCGAHLQSLWRCQCMPWLWLLVFQVVPWQYPGYLSWLPGGLEVEASLWVWGGF